MACVNPDGSISGTARSVLEALVDTHDEQGLAQATNHPLYRLRSSLRELQEAGLVTIEQGRISLTAAGRRAIT